ncbi:MAG: DNA polymerase I [Deltaproteobacteria bacterium]|nr:DNA polymerase I [Deltaproteobacteria bacterium]
MTTPGRQIFLVDGQSYIYRAFYAVKELANSQGFPTNAIFGFANMLQRLREGYAPSHLAVVFDAKGKNFRHDLYPKYKIRRLAMPETMRPQIPRIKELIRAYRIPTIELAGYEADDILATLVTRWEREGDEVVLVSGDKDLMQLVSPHVTMLDTMKDERIGIEQVKLKFGVEPARVVEVQGLMGDATDDIPGIPGVGEKTAIKLINEWHDLENLLAHAVEIPGKLGEKIREHAELARVSKTLATLHRDVPIQVDLEDLARKDPDTEQLKALFREFEFRRFLAEIESPWDTPQEGFPAPAQAGEYETVWTVQKLEQVVQAIRAAKSFCLDTETTSLDPLNAELVGVSLAIEEGKAWYIPVGHRGEEATPQLPLAHVVAVLRTLLEDPTLALIGQNAKYDVMVLEKYGLWPTNLTGDTMLASYVLNPSRRHNLNDLAWEHLQYRMVTYESVTEGGKKNFAEVSITDATRYSGEDADLTLRLAHLLFPRVQEEGMGQLFVEVEVPLATVLARMELTGIRIDGNLLGELSVEFGAQRRRLEKEIHELAGEEFNISSPQQLQTILFDKLGLPRGKKTKTGSSTDSSVLEALAEQYPLPAKILAYRGFTKLQSTYVDALPKLLHPRTGRIHTSFNQTVTATGRLSSSNPNLQNIPVRSEEGRRIRAAFVPEPGWVLLSADYSQIELRLLAHLSQDPVLVESFQRGQDVHARTAAELFQTPLAAVSPDQRREAKTINFGIIYGMGALRLGRSLGIPFKTAQEYISQYFARYANIKAYMDSILVDAKACGYVTTLLGRRRYVPELQSKNAQLVAAAERMAINAPIQGTAADLIKIAMVAISRRLAQEKLQARMLLQVHDELLFEVEEASVAPVMVLVRECMENVMALRVPLKVDLGTGVNWAEAH